MNWYIQKLYLKAKKLERSKEILYRLSKNPHNIETLCIHCQGWGKVLYNKNIKEGKYVQCTTCNGELLIDTKKVADILGKCEQQQDNTNESNL